jgi:uncharacterized protein YcbK (DUF882 family)
MLARDSGQVVPLAALLVGLAAGAILLLVHLGARSTNQARAQGAADAAALAAVLDGAPAAASLAAANGAELELLEESTAGATVRVHVSGQHAVARAEPLDQVGLEGLAPQLVEAIRHAERLLGQPLPIVSGYRTAAAQQALWDARHSNPYPVAPPGTSQHELGQAIDVRRDFVPRLKPLAGVVGLCQPLPTTDPVHFVMCRMTATP